MASVDFNTFFSAFVVHFLQNMDGLDNDQRTTLKENFKTDTVSNFFYHRKKKCVHYLFIYWLNIVTNSQIDRDGELIITIINFIDIESDH